MNKLEIRGITKCYERGKPVIDNINLSVRDGELFFLLGPSGCGKSTLLRIIAGFLDADSGRVVLDGQDITDLAPEKRGTPMVFQSYALWPHLNVFENIAFGLKLKKLMRAEIKCQVESMLHTVKMTEFATRRVGSLSGGQQQRVALARALALEPRLLLLDEPLSNLDAKLRDTMRYEIRRICKERGLTAVYVTHDRREALSMADQVAILHQGRLEQVAPPHEIYGAPLTRFAAAFLGDANFVDGVFCSSAGGIHEFASSLGSLRSSFNPGFTLQSGTTYTLMFRPENLLAEPPATFAGNILETVIAGNSFLGESTCRMLSINDCELLLNEPGARLRGNGVGLRVGLAPENLTIIKQDRG